MVCHRVDVLVRIGSLGLATLLAACSSDSGGPGQYAPGTCQESCEKAVALACPNEAFADVPTCVAQCEDQISGCSDQSVIDDYLGCAVATPMVCGDTLGIASSPDCVSEGLLFFACLQGIDVTDVGGTDTGTGSDTSPDVSGEAVDPPAVPSVTAGQLAFSLRVGDDTVGPFTCTVGSDGGVTVQTLPEAAGGGTMVQGYCNAISGGEVANLNFSVVRPDLGPGSFDIATFSGPDAIRDAFSIQWYVDGNGYTMNGQGNGGVVFDGELVIDSIDPSSGAATGHVTATWPRTGDIVGGVAMSIHDWPGAASVAFQVP